VNRLKQAAAPPEAVVMVHRGPRAELAWRHPPLATAAGEVHQPVDDRPLVGRRPPAFAGAGFGQ